MGRTGSRHSSKRPSLRWLLLAPLLALGVMGAPQAEINHIVCLTVYYTIDDGEPQYIHDDCYFPVSYPERNGGDSCWTPDNEVGLTVCRSWKLAYPMP